MNTKRIKNPVVFVVMFFAVVHVVQANLEITEVNYNPAVKTNHLWIKVFNNTSDEVDLSLWSVADYDGTSWHYHTINADGSSALSPSSYAIIAKASSTTIDDFKSKNPDVSDPLFYGNLTIENEGVLGLSNDKKTVISSKSYGGASIPPDTNTNNDTNEVISSSTNVSSSSSSTSKTETKIYNITTKIISPKIVTAGVPFTIDHTTTGTKKEKIVLGKFVWNFGDGMTKVGATSSPFEYTYQYPGEYILTLSYFDSSFDIAPDAVDRLAIKVILSGITISSVGTPSDPFIEIENNSSYEMSIHGFVIKGSIHSFVIPEGMIILPNKKLKLSPKITGFDFNDLSSISIMDQSGQLFATYPKQNIPAYKHSTNNGLSEGFVKSEIITDNNVDSYEKVINLNDISVSAENSGININNKYLVYLGLVGVITIGIFSVILFRRKNEIPDYIDSEISAKDMTIIE